MIRQHQQANKQVLKREQELWVFERFTGYCNIRADTILQEASDPVPDFLIRQNNSTIGIELTEATFSNAKRSVSLQNELIRLAEERYDNLLSKSERSPSLIPKGHVIFNYRNNRRGNLGISKSEKHIIASRIAELLYNDSKSVSQDADDIYSYRMIKRYGLEEIFSDITFLPSSDCPKLFWHPPSQMFRSGSIGSERIQNLIGDCIRKKEARYSDYMLRCDKCWLVIYALDSACSLIDISEHDEATEKMYQTRYADSPFERIVLVSFGGSRNIIDLKLLSLTGECHPESQHE